MKFTWRIFEEEFEEIFGKEEDGFEGEGNEELSWDKIREQNLDFEGVGSTQEHALSDYLVDAYYVHEYAGVVENFSNNAERQEEYISRLDRLCNGVNSLIWGTKGYIDYSRQLVNHFGEINDRDIALERNISGYLDSLYINVREFYSERIVEREEEKEVYLRNITELMETAPKYENALEHIYKIEQAYQDFRESSYRILYKMNPYKNRLFALISRLPEKLGNIYLLRKQYYVMNRNGYRIRWNASRERVFLASMIISSVHFEEYALRIITLVQRTAEKYVYIVCKENYIYNDSDFFAQVGSLEQQIVRIDGFKTKYVRKNGCFALMHIYNLGKSMTEKLIAFSGQQDCDDICIRNYFELNEDQCRNLVKAIEKLIHLKFSDYIWARTTQDVKYYEQSMSGIVTESIQQHMVRVPYIMSGSIDNIREKFSCCERKMLEEIKMGSTIAFPVDSYSLFTRHPNCDKCKLALDEFERMNTIASGSNRRYFSLEY